MDKPAQAQPIQENTAQLNTNKSNKKELNTDLSNTYLIKSYQKECDAEQTEVFAKEQTDRIVYDKEETYRQIIKDNIEYDILSLRNERDIAMLDEIVDLMTEMVCTQKSSLVIAGNIFPAEIVKSKLLKLNSVLNKSFLHNKMPPLNLIYSFYQKALTLANVRIKNRYNLFAIISLANFQTLLLKLGYSI